MSVFERWFRAPVLAKQAVRAEARGELPRATELWLEAGRPDEAARVLLLRAASDTDPHARLPLLLLASRTAKPGGTMQAKAVTQRARLLFALADAAGASGPSATTRVDLIDVGLELETLGLHDVAAEAYGRAGDRERRAEALSKAGDVERLEELLDADLARSNQERTISDHLREVELLTQAGEREEALLLAEKYGSEGKVDASLTALAKSLRRRKAPVPCTPIVFQGEEVEVVWGSEVLVGRTEGSLRIASPAVSRSHLQLTRSESGFLVRDLGSRNGTLVRGMPLTGSIPIGGPLSLLLGGTVELQLAPSPRFGEALDILVGGRRYVAPLGPLVLPKTGWTLLQNGAGWVELRSAVPQTPFRDGVALGPRITLLTGDRFSQTAKGPIVFCVPESSS